MTGELEARVNEAIAEEAQKIVDGSKYAEESIQERLTDFINRMMHWGTIGIPATASEERVQELLEESNGRFLEFGKVDEQ